MLFGNAAPGRHRGVGNVCLRNRRRFRRPPFLGSVREISQHLAFNAALCVFLIARNMFRFRLRSPARRAVIFFAADVVRVARKCGAGIAPVISTPRVRSSVGPYLDSPVSQQGMILTGFVDDSHGPISQDIFQLALHGPRANCKNSEFANDLVSVRLDGLGLIDNSFVVAFVNC